MKLYEYNEAFVDLKMKLDYGEIDQKTFQDTYEALEMGADEKAENTLKFIKNNEAELEVLKAEKQRIADMEKKLKGTNDFLTSGLENYYKTKYGEELGKQKLGTHELGIKKLPDVVEVEDEMELPEAYLEYTPKVMKTPIKKALQDGEEVPGAKMITGRTKFYVK